MYSYIVTDLWLERPNLIRVCEPNLGPFYNKITPFRSSFPVLQCISFLHLPTTFAFWKVRVIYQTPVMSGNSAYRQRMYHKCRHTKNKTNEKQINERNKKSHQKNAYKYSHTRNTRTKRKLLSPIGWTRRHLIASLIEPLYRRSSYKMSNKQTRSPFLPQTHVTCYLSLTDLLLA